ncbi:polymer-forming cytoskeletal protein [Thermus sp.]|jgi:cytoskeletal protein CcmA (bactofilin family)|uniref:bactofilin family protein n=1 Tax=Thermus sp. TaxID=275 RepID=UPI0028CC82A7|nr:polymer-forming cytoskeletal protein [Thermus sp.]MDT7909972.1 polymer-forming cytoskeletal protein [Thermus sp.]MDT7922681.1 polymer-forming cytoskeletal protein [Thermus sp.]
MGRMLGRKKRVLTYLGPETEVLGDLKARGQVRVDGLVRGSVWVEGELEVGRTGRVEGERVEAQAIQVHGEVRADLVAERVFLAKTARLTGNVRAQALEVEAGAVFVGQSVAGETRALEAPKEA